MQRCTVHLLPWQPLQAPLWIEFENQQVDNQLQMGRSIKLIIKHGDDLRQDMLTLQMLRIMDKVITHSGRMGSWWLSMSHDVT